MSWRVRALFVDVLHQTELAHLSIVPSTKDLVGAEIELVGTERREYRIKDALVSDPRSIRLYFSRLSSVAGSLDGECSHRGGFTFGSDSKRVLRFGGIELRFSKR